MQSDRDDNRRTPSWLHVGGTRVGGVAVDAEFGGSAGALPEPGDLVAGKYRIEQVIGRGGMGAVFRATNVQMDKPVALKWLLPERVKAAEARERFLQEARVAARVSHPNVVDVYDVGFDGSALFMVMELLQGEPFEALLERGEIPIPDMLQILVQAMHGVSAAHARGVIHRDIKPDNIFVVPDATQASGFRAKVLDFGISKLTDDEQREQGITRSGVTMGTPAYMSLEQVNGARNVDARTDVYAFGVLLYRALTGQLPYQGDTFGAMAVALATMSAPAPKALRPDLPVALSDIVMKAMARDRRDRFESAHALLTALSKLSTAEAYLGQMTNPSTVPPRITPAERRRSGSERDRPTASLPAADGVRLPTAPTESGVLSRAALQGGGSQPITGAELLRRRALPWAWIVAALVVGGGGLYWLLSDGAPSSQVAEHDGLGGEGASGLGASEQGTDSVTDSDTNSDTDTDTDTDSLTDSLTDSDSDSDSDSVTDTSGAAANSAPEATASAPVKKPRRTASPAKKHRPRRPRRRPADEPQADEPVEDEVAPEPPPSHRSGGLQRDEF